MNRDFNNLVSHTFVLNKDHNNMENKVKTDKTLSECEPISENPLKCKICGKVCDKLCSFVSHQRTHLDDRPKTCKVCQKTFIDRISLKRHILTENHIESLAYEKDYVPKCRDSFSELQKEFINQSCFNCQICNEVFSDESVLNYHLLQHELSTKSKCKKSANVRQNATAMSSLQGKTVNIKKSSSELDSSKIFNNKNSLTDHLCLKKDKYWAWKRIKKLKTAEVFQCNKCQEMYESSNALSLHFCNSAQLKTYSRPRKLLECNISQKAEEKKTSTKEYEVHNEELTCDVCKQNCKSERDLNSHLKCHLRDIFICEDCQVAFNDKESLEFHRRSITKKEFVCKICNEIFCCSRNLINHHKVHGFTCDICLKSFLKKFHLYLHYFSHSENVPFFICSVCFKTFGTRNDWVSHYCIHIGIKPLLCEICNKLFLKRRSLYLHCRSHTEEKPYSCEVCEKQFKYFNSMVMHRNTHSKKVSH